MSGLNTLIPSLSRRFISFYFDFAQKKKGSSSSVVNLLVKRQDSYRKGSLK